LNNFPKKSGSITRFMNAYVSTSKLLNIFKSDQDEVVTRAYHPHHQADVWPKVTPLQSQPCSSFSVSARLKLMRWSLS
jgi:hypothetical protein